MENLKKYKTQVLSNKNLILSGAPGTGKSYLAKLIAASIIGCDKDELIGSKQFQFVQFHPSYDYTDFVEGLRPYQKKVATILDSNWSRAFFIVSAKML